MNIQPLGAFPTHFTISLIKAPPRLEEQQRHPRELPRSPHSNSSSYSPPIQKRLFWSIRTGMMVKTSIFIHITMPLSFQREVTGHSEHSAPKALTPHSVRCVP